MGFILCSIELLLTYLSVSLIASCSELTSSCEHREITNFAVLMVRCSGSNITHIPNGLPLHTAELHIEHGNIQTLNASVFHGLQNLTVLKVEYSGLVNIEKNAFDNVPSLRKVSLKGNRLVFLENGTFLKLKYLTSIDLSENQITIIEEPFTGLQNLEKLSLQSNEISVIAPNAFKDLSSLHHLELHDNDITSLHPLAFSNNKNLMFLSLASNPLTDLSNTFPTDMILHYLNVTNCKLGAFPNDLPPSVKYLQMSGNQIRYIAKKDLTTYVNLSALILGNNELSLVEKGAFTALSSLTDLFLFVNHLQIIPGPFPLSMKSLHLDNNNITDFDADTFQSGTNLTILSIRNNKISSLSSNTFLNFKSIKELHLEGNPITTLMDNIFVTLNDLHYLNLNRIDFHLILASSFQGLKDLRKLEMSFVKTNGFMIFGDIFKPLIKLDELQLQESPSLAQKFLNHIENVRIETLKELNLMDNGLTHLNPTVEKHLPNLRKLALSGNKFLCDSDLLWLKMWYIREPDKFFMFNQVHCHLPDQLHGLPIKDVPIYEFLTSKPDHSQDSTSMRTNEPFDEGMSTQDYIFETATNDPFDFEYGTYYEDYSHTDDPYDNYEYQTFSTITITKDNIITSMSSTTSLSSKGVDNDKYGSTTPQTEFPTTVFIHSGDNDPTVPDYKPPTKQKDTAELKAVGIAIAMSFGVILVMLIIAFITYKICRRKRQVLQQNGRNHCEGQDYVFVATHNDKPEPKPQRKLSRTERGSTTSKASEDITNHTDLDMKVYMLDVDA